MVLSDYLSDLGRKASVQSREGNEEQGLPCHLPPASSPLAVLSTLCIEVSLSEYKMGEN